MNIQPNTTIRDYTILSKLGEGGMGTVWLAEEKNLGRKVAIKVLTPQLAADPTFVERFRQEARVQAQLVHSGIVALYNFFEVEGSLFMVLEYAPGKTLKQIIESEGKLNPERAKEIFKQLLDAVGHAHTLGIIHRDIKPSNVVVSDEGSVKILDFGIAKIMGDRGMTKTGAKVGTVYYMSPEQVRGLKDIDQRTDIYSLGIVFYEMLTGTVPFDINTESDFDIMQEIVQGNHNLESTDYDKDFYKIVFNMITPEKCERPATCWTILESLNNPSLIVSNDRVNKIRTGENLKLYGDNIATKLVGAKSTTRIFAFILDLVIFTILYSLSIVILRVAIIGKTNFIDLYNNAYIEFISSVLSPILIVDRISDFLDYLSKANSQNKLKVFRITEFTVYTLFLFLFFLRDMISDGYGIAKRFFGLKLVLMRKSNAYNFLLNNFIRNTLLVLIITIPFSLDYFYKIEFDFSRDNIQLILFASATYWILEFITMSIRFSSGQRITDYFLKLKVVKVDAYKEYLQERNLR